MNSSISLVSQQSMMMTWMKSGMKTTPLAVSVGRIHMAIATIATAVMVVVIATLMGNAWQTLTQNQSN